MYKNLIFRILPKIQVSGIEICILETPMYKNSVFAYISEIRVSKLYYENSSFQKKYNFGISNSKMRY